MPEKLLNNLNLHLRLLVDYACFTWDFDPVTTLQVKVQWRTDLYHMINLTFSSTVMESKNHKAMVQCREGPLQNTSFVLKITIFQIKS